MCGATDQQKELETQQAAMYKEMSDQYKQVFGEQQAILKTLTDQFTPILKAGSSQRGFSDAERTDLQTQAKTNVASNFANAKKALQENLAARGGSDFLPSGADVQMEGGLEATAAAEESSLGQQIDLEDYGLGRENWLTAVNALGSTANMQNPVGFAEATTGAGNATSKTANDIAAADNSIWSSVIGGISGIAGAAVGGWTGGLGKGKGTAPAGTGGA